MRALLTTVRDHARNFLGAACLLVGALGPGVAHAQSSTVVISELYVGGGTANAPYKNDFVELYNKTSTPISLSGYSIQYNPASGGGSYSVIALTGTTIPANGYVLVQLGGTLSPGDGADLPAPYVPVATGTNPNQPVVGGRIALVNGNTVLVDPQPANTAGVVDFLGYGTATTAEGAGPALGATNFVSLERKARAGSTSASMGTGGDDADQGNGYDTNDNSTDFVTRGPEPQNTASAAEVFVPTTVYFNTKNPAGKLNELSTYSTTPDGTGPSPVSFATKFQTFTISGDDRTIAGDWVVTSTGSRVVLTAGADLLVPTDHNFTGVLDLGPGATLIEENAAPAVSYGSVDATSTIEFAQAGTYTAPMLPGAGYGNLTLRNGTKRLGTTTTVRGNLLVSNVGANLTDVFGGAPASASVLNLGGNLTLAGTVRFSGTADDRITLVATNTGTPQVLDGGGNALKLYRLTLPAGQAGVSLANATTNLELGNTAGGGYQLATGTVLTVNDNLLAFAESGLASINTGTNSTGMLALSAGSSLFFSRSAGSLGTLLLTPGSTQLRDFTLNAASASSTFTLPASLTIAGTLALRQGVLTVGSGNVLTLNGPVVTTSGQVRGDFADLVIGGSGTLGALRPGGGANGYFQRFTLNRAGQTLTLTGDLRVTTALNVLAGTLALGDTDTYLDGALTTTATGLVQGSAVSNLRIGGTGPLGTLGFTASGAVLNILSLNRPFGTLTLAGGTVQIDKPTLTSGVLALGPDVALTITGQLVVADPAVAQFAGTPSSILNFTGSGAIGPLAFVPGQDQLLSLTLARNTNSTPPTAQLTTNLTVNSLALTRGRIFVQGAMRLTILPGGSLSNGGNFGFINKLSQAAVTNATTPTVSLTYPLGVGDQYRPLTFTVTDQVIGTTTYTAQQLEARSPQRTLPPTLLRVSQLRYYNVVRESGNSVLASATIRLSYTPSTDLTNTGNNSLLRVAMTDPADNSRWANIGGMGSGADITSDPFPAGPLGDFTLATDIDTPTNNNPLPVELSAFGAQRFDNGSVSVRWTTASEQNSDYFDVQRSANGRDFATIATATAQGTSSQTSAYAALDKTAPATVLYYRLRQVDRDGTARFSSAVSVAGSDKPLDLAVYPNPATELLTATLPAQAGRTYRVLNTLGQVVDRGPAEAANPALSVRALPAGTYLLELQGPAGRQVRRFVKGM